MAPNSTPLLLHLLLLLSTFSKTGNTVFIQQDLVTCLTATGVRNFTTASETLFPRLLNFSIQNLRFVDSSLPKPSVVIFPETREDLQSAVLCSRRASVLIRVRSGGHSYEGLSYLAGPQTPFGVIDLMNLNGVRVDPDLATAWIESGATLGEAYYAIAESSRGTLGLSAGSCPTVGTGGHVAGGGFGLMSRKYGLAADNVVDAVLVDPTGRLLDRNSMGEDVFWAIRGGGGGTWGAVYAWRVQLVPVPPRVSCFIVSRPGSVRFVTRLVNRWQRVAPVLPEELYLSVFVGASLPEVDRPGMSATFKGFFLGPGSEAGSILNRQFPELKVSLLDWREMSWIESVVFFSGLGKGRSVSDLKDRLLHGKNYFKAKSDYVRTHISINELLSAFTLLETQPKAYLILDPYGGAMDRIRSDHIPFPHRNGNLYTIQYLIEWTEGENEKRDEYMDWLRDYYHRMGPLVSKSPRAAYVNYLDLDLGSMGSKNAKGSGEGFSDAVAEARAWGERYFLGNYDRLVLAKTAIDPNNVFANAQSVPPSFVGLMVAKQTREGMPSYSST